MSILQQQQPVMIMAGGTGGHVYPGLAVARALLAQQVPVIWLGTPKGLEARVVPAAGIVMRRLSISGIRRKGIWTLFLAPLRLAYACCQAAWIILTVKPCLVLGMGGFVAGPGGLVCRLLRTPLIIHEQNAIPGLTNRLLARIANSVLQAFPNTFKTQIHAYHTGNPVREDIASLHEPTLRLADRSGPLRILIIGGSQGAQFLNQVLPLAIKTMPSGLWPEIRHQAGPNFLTTTEQVYHDKKITAHVVAFIDDMAANYAWADLVIARSGAMTVAELAAAGVASILVPYPYAVDDHQTENARYLADNGAAILASQNTLTPEQLGDWLSELSVDRSRLLKMAQQARAMARADATQLVVRECLAVAGSYR